MITPPSAEGPPRPLIPPRAPCLPIPDVQRIVAVASGKGGVGKSTVAVNLAAALAATGRAVGVLDADVYGPSVPCLLGLKGPPKLEGEGADARMIPLERYDLRVMSMGFLVKAEDALIWRGPRLHAALLQMLRRVAWGALDVLILDMPPGTGDVALTLTQAVPVTGAVIVSTPQDVALQDARRAVAMFRRMSVPVVGLVENMSAFVCPHCGGLSTPFGQGGARVEAERLGVPFWGAVPLEAGVRAASDAGIPAVLESPSGAAAEAFRGIAQQLEAVWDHVPENR